MALFKILRGPSGNFHSDLSKASNWNYNGPGTAQITINGQTKPLNPKFTDGYCYYLIDSHLFYIDYEKENGEKVREPLNAKDAQRLLDSNGTIYTIDENRSLSDTDFTKIPTSGALGLRFGAIANQIDAINDGLEALGTNKMDKVNPTGSGSLSINRLKDSTVGTNSVALGFNNIASGSASYAEGNTTISTGITTHAEGHGTTASGDYSHAEGYATAVSGKYAHVGGVSSTITNSGEAAFAHGLGLSVKTPYQTVFGKYNAEQTDALFMIGNGTSATDRDSIFVVNTAGNGYFKGTLAVGSTMPSNSTHHLYVNGSAQIVNQLQLDTAPTAANHATNKAYVDNNKVARISSSSDNAIARFDGTTGQIQNSGIFINDSNVLTSPTTVIINGTESNDGSGQLAMLKALSTAAAASGTSWVGRSIFGAKNLTFLMGTYNGMACIGAHSWTNAAAGTGAAWAPMYFQADGGANAAIYMGQNGTGWTANTGTVEIKGSATAKGGSVVINGTLNVAKNIETSQNLTISGDLTVNGNGNFVNDVNVAKNLTVSGSGTITGGLTVGNGITGNLNGNATTSDRADNGIFYVDGDATATAGAWTGTNTSIPGMYQGLTIAFKIGVAGGSSGTTLNLTTAAGASGAKNVFRGISNLTTHLSVGTVVVLVYDGADWRWADYSANDSKVRIYRQTSGYNGDYPILVSRTATASIGTAGTNDSYTGVFAVIGQNGTYTPTINPHTGVIKASQVWGAVWNDYAEYRKQVEFIEPGYCVASNNKGEVYKTIERLQVCDGIVSDTFGFAIGKTKQSKTPLAVSGRVLAYCEDDIYEAGDIVAAGPNGKVVKMTREEIKEYPDRIIGHVSEIPNYDTWGTGNVNVNGRIWIKIH